VFRCPSEISQEIRQPEALNTDAGKTLIEDDDVDMFLGGEAAREGLGDSAHSLALAVMTDPKRSIAALTCAGRRRAEGSTAAAAGAAAWFGGAKRVAEPGCSRSERRILADVRSMSARTSYSTISG
jgi:hypothetical protein